MFTKVRVSRLEVQAFAKLNLTLEVLGRREDGYHQVRTILQTIDLADLLEVSPARTLRVECDDRSLQGDANLVWQAARALAEAVDHPPGAHIYIQKRIPVGMGLGGGSSDAAAALARSPFRVGSDHRPSARRRPFSPGSD